MHRDKFVKIAIPILAFLLLNSVYLAFSASSNPQIQAAPKWDPWDFPRLDTLYMVEAWYEETALTMAKECKIDVYLGATTEYAVETLRTEGWTVTHSGGGLHYCYFGFNCRPVQPPWTASHYDYYGRTPGFKFYPVNITCFHHALAYVIGCERTAWLWDIFKYTVVRNDFPMPPGFGEWINPYIPKYYTEDWVYAEDILLENDFTVVKPNPADRTTWVWYNPDGSVLVGGKNSAHPGSDRYASGDGSVRGILVISPYVGVSREIVNRHVKKWNKFFIGEEVGGFDTDVPYALFHQTPLVDLGTIVNVVWYNRNHDIFYLCGSFSARNPDYLYDTFHSANDIEGGDNDAGLVNEGLDKMLYTVKYFKVKDWELLAYNVGDEDEKLIPASTHYIVNQPADIKDVKIERCHKTGVTYQYLLPGIDYELIGNDLHILKDITLYIGDALEINYNFCTYLRGITDVDEYRDIVWLVDWKIFYLGPQIGNYGRDYYDMFKPGHAGWVEGIGYGAGTYILPWTFGNIHETSWTPYGGSMKWQNEGDVVTLNPIKATWVYEVEILNRIYEGLITRDPRTGQEMPWIALKIEETSWKDPPSVPDGQKIRITIRDDVTWQDGTPVTAEDIKWNFDYINHTCPDIGARMPEYKPIWEVYVKTVVVSDYVVDIFISSTGHWKTLDYLGAALQFPQVIWEGPNYDGYNEATAFKPWAVSYKTRTGVDPPSGLGNSLSCLMGTGPFFLNMTAGGWDESGLAVLSKYPGYWKRLANPGDITLDMVVNEDDLWFFCARFIDYYKSGIPHYLCDYSPNEKLDEDDYWFFCARFIDYYKYGLHGP